MKCSPRFLLLVSIFTGLFATICGAAPRAGAPMKILRDGQARYKEIDQSKLPAGTAPKLFAGEISGMTFDLFVRQVAAQTVTIEMGFVDTQGKGPSQNAFSLAANGFPLDANLDVWAKAGGGFKPWVTKMPFVHGGGALSLLFTGLGKPAFVSYVRITGADGQEIAFGTASDWQKPERLTLLDSRSRPFHHVKVGDVAFFDVDHSPVGSWSTFIYGMENSGGVQSCKQPGGEGTLIPDQGVIIAVKNGDSMRLMPFASKQPGMPKTALIGEKEVTRTLGPCTDTWKIPGGVSWTHYTPVWKMDDWEKATPEEKRRFVLPVTWMQYKIDNRSGKEETQLLFSLEQPAAPAQEWKGFDGYVVEENTSIAVKKGDANLLTSEQVKKEFNLDGATSAFCVHVPAGQEKVVTFYIAQYKPGVVAELNEKPLRLMCDALYKDIDDILTTAQASLPAVISRCEEVDKKLAACKEDDERKFLAADTVHSYQFNTVLEATEKMEPVWSVIEGECSCINTFDLTVDHVFYELSMHPWTVRNELDNFTNTFSYTDELSLPGQTQRFPGGISFCHDMGSRLSFSSKAKGARYSNLMTQEELQNWIICGALYWKKTGDNGWLEKNKEVFNDALKSMQLRDDLDPKKRDGITTYVSNRGEKSGEITTYDAMDASLQHPIDSLYIAGKSFASYAMMVPVFQQLGEEQQANEAKEAVTYTAKGILSHWDESRKSFPALFNGSTTATSSIIPAVEGLAYPYAMGLTKELAMDGPNGDLIRHLKTHIETILVPGVCIDSETGGWNLSSSSSTTWVSKVYLNQFVVENVLGIKNAATGATADSAHYAYEVLGAPAVGWTDQFFTSSHTAYGCRHYPRGVTSALWWLWPENSEK